VRELGDVVGITWVERALAFECRHALTLRVSIDPDDRTTLVELVGKRRQELRARLKTRPQ
jgi:hypothetical protein